MKTIASFLAVLLSTTNAFVIRTQATKPSSTTRLFLEDWVAKLIDEELYREAHKKEFENEWMEKNRAAVVGSLNDDSYMMTDVDDYKENFRIHVKDQKLAERDPQAYCADRCVTTGNCDVFEDFFDLGPEEVLKFCNDCVLSDDEEPCDVPDGFYDKLTP